MHYYKESAHSLSMKVFTLDPVDWSSNPSVVGSQQLHIASVDSAANEYQPSGLGGALHQSDILARGCDTPKLLHIIEKGISSCGIPH